MVYAGHVFISWAHGSGPGAEQRTNEVMAFATLLRNWGIDADIDLFHTSEDPDWTRWGEQQINRSDKVICLITKEWSDRWAGENDPRVGAGAVAEADSLRSLFQTNQEEFQQRVKLVFLPSELTTDPPSGLHHLARFRIEELSDTGGISVLYRSLTGQAEWVVPQRGTPKHLPPRNDPSSLPPDRDVSARRDLTKSALRRATQVASALKAGHVPAGIHPADLHQGVKVVLTVPERGEILREASPVDGEPAGASGTPEIWWDAARTPWKTVVVQGTPGAGKTWLLSHHARSFATAGLAEGDTAHSAVPLLFTCAAFGRNLPPDPELKHLAAAIVRTLEKDESYAGAARSIDGFAAEVSSLWDDGEILLCIDGFDELPPALRSPVTLALTIVVGSANRLVVGSRPNAILELTSKMDCAVVTLVPFTQPRMLGFIAAWHAAHPEVAADLQNRLRLDSRLRALLSNPLMLRFMCQLATVGRDMTRLPTSRTALLHELSIAILGGRLQDSDERRAIPYGREPEPKLRLNALSSAVLRLGAAWRGGAGSSERRSLESSLREERDYERLSESSIARWAEWQRTQRTEPDRTPPADPVVWEFVFDGFLLEEASGTGARIDFAHPLLYAFCMGNALAQLDPRSSIEMLDIHVWFDEGWTEAIPISIALSKHRGMLVAALLGHPQDPWYMRRILLARALAASPENFETELRSIILIGLGEALVASRRFDRARAVDALVELVLAGVPEAVLVAGELQVSERGLDLTLRLRLAVALLKVDVKQGADFASAMLRDANLASGDRARVLAALYQSGDADALSGLIRHMQLANTSEEARDYLAQLPIEDKLIRARIIEMLAAESLRRPWVPLAAQALAEYSGATAIELLAAVRTSKQMSILMRAEVIISLLKVGALGSLELLTDLQRDPNFPAATRGQIAAAVFRYTLDLDSQVQRVLLDGRTDWQLRRDLARLAARSAPVQLRSLAEASNEPWVRVRLLSALVETRDAWAIAAALDYVSMDHEVTAIRIRLYSDLLAVGERIDLDAAADLVRGWLHDSDWARDRLVIELVKRGVDFGRDFHRTYVAQKDDFLELLCRAGYRGESIVLDIALDDKLRISTRLAASSALVKLEAGVGPLTDKLFSTESLSHISERLVLVQARLRTPGILERLIQLLSTAPGAYPALFDFLQDPSTTREWVDRAVFEASLARDESIPPSPHEGESSELNDDWLAGKGIVTSSPAVAAAMLRETYQILEHRVGREIAAGMDDEELSEFESLVTSDAEATAWLQSWFPAYSLVVRQELDILAVELLGRYGNQVSDEDFPRLAPLIEIESVARELNAWVKVGAGGINGETFTRLRESSLLRHPIAKDVLRLAMKQSAWPALEAHLYLLTISRNDLSNFEHGARWDVLLDRIRAHLAAREDMDALCASALSVLCFPLNEVGLFYASASAACVGWTTLALEIMRKCVSAGPEDTQRASGVQTIRDLAASERISADVAIDLIAILTGTI